MQNLIEQSALDHKKTIDLLINNESENIKFLALEMAKVLKNN